MEKLYNFKKSTLRKSENKEEKDFVKKTPKNFANLKLDKETKEFINEIKEKEKPVDRNGFCGYFGYEPSALVSNLLNQKKLG